MQRRWWMWSSLWRICACELYSLSYSLDGTLPDKWPAEWTKMEGKAKADDDDEHEDVDVVLACTAASSVWHCHWFMAIGCYLSFVAQTFLLSIWLFVDRVGHLDGYFLLSIGCCCSSWLLCICCQRVGDIFTLRQQQQTLCRRKCSMSALCMPAFFCLTKRYQFSIPWSTFKCVRWCCTAC